MPFEFDAKAYQQASAHQQEWGARLIDELDLTGSERILDVGCGDGRLTARLADLVPNGAVVGIDASAAMIEVARRHERGNLAVQLLDVTQSSFRDEFDIVFSNSTLHWVKDHVKLLALLHAALKTGGILRVQFAADGTATTFNRVAQDLMASERFHSSFADFEWPWYMPSITAYEDLVNRSPFTEASVWGEVVDRYFPNAEAMIGWIDQPSLVPFMQRVDTGTGSEFRDAVITRMIEEARRDDGTCFETFRRVNLCARK